MDDVGASRPVRLANRTSTVEMAAPEGLPLGSTMAVTVNKLAPEGLPERENG